MTVNSRSPHVLIAGAGLAGLTLAQSLRKTGTSYEIFERDHSKAEKRGQGWAIGIHGMLSDLKASVPDDMPPIETVKHSKPLGSPAEVYFWTPDSTQKVGLRDDGSDTVVIRANRTRLRDVEESEEKVTVRFEDGTAAVGDIQVGADGVNSAVRKHALKGPDDPLVREPLTVLSDILVLSGADMEEVFKLGYSASVFIMRQPGQYPANLFIGLNQVSPDAQSGEYYFNLTFRDPDAAAADHWTRSASKEELRAAALDMVRRYDVPEKLARIVEITPASGMVRPPLGFCTLMMGEKDARTGRVTLVGDAGHAMTPLRGEGGYHAMLDALILGRVLAQIDAGDIGRVKEAMAAHQAEMLARGAKGAALSQQSFELGATQGERFVWGVLVSRLEDQGITLQKLRQEQMGV
ncbi:putative monooxygenase [Xylariaceae sp. FL0016]|nr:putative monooxygenase [Xylariaceae sp. FL0016]